MEEAKQKAFQGGYPYRDNPDGTSYALKNDAELLLDPLFWSSLGKAMGWKGDDIRLCVGCGRALKHNERNCKCGDGCIHYFNGQWVVEWHRFIDHLIEGKDAESFFANILK